MLKRTAVYSLFWLLCLFCLLGSRGVAYAQENSQEYQVKAAFLVNFARFIAWPENAPSPEGGEITFCIAGKNPFGTALNALDNKQINSRSIKVVYAPTFQNLPLCNLLFVGGTENSYDLKQLLPRITKGPTVTVSDIPGFVEAGGSIEFVIKEDRLSFIINNSDLKQRGIQASASMLDLAASVR